MDKPSVTAPAPVRSKFACDVVTLATGTASGQALTILAAPLMTRLYLPEDYGVFALWGAIIGIAAVVAGGRYEGAILLPKEDTAAAALLYVSVSLTGVVALVLLGPVVLFHTRIADAFGSPELAGWLIFIPPMLILTNLGQGLSTWANRRQAYSTLAWSRTTGAVVGIGANIIMGFAGLGPVGLVGGAVSGQVVAIAILGGQFWGKDRGGGGTMRLGAMRTQAQKYINFPKFSLWSDLINLVSSQLVTLMLPRMFGLAALGSFSMGQRVIGVPSNLIGSAVGEVFRGQASRDYAEHGNCLEIFRKTFKHLLLLSLVPFVILLVAAPYLFALVFGEKWRMAGQMAQIMSIMYLPRFIVSSLSHTYFLANRQREDLLLHLWILVSSAAALWLGYHATHSVVMTLLCFSANFATIYVFTLWRAHTFAAGVEK